MIYRELPWDSDFFRVSAGALTVEAGDTAEELSAALAEHSAEVCYIFVPQDAGSGLSGWLQTSGAKCYDRKTVFAKPLAGRLPEKLRPGLDRSGPGGVRCLSLRLGKGEFGENRTGGGR